MIHKIFGSWKNLSHSQWLSRILALAFLVSIVPVLALAFYSHPAGDDYAYGLAAHLAWKETHSIISVLKAAVQNVAGYYNTWQGTYASIFLMSLQPAVISQRLYPLTTFLMLGMLCGGTWLLIRTIFTHYLKLEKSLWQSLALSVLFLSVHVLDEGKSAFYWFNGALHYVFMHSCMLFFLSFVLLYLKAEKRRARTAYFLLSCFLAVVIGGANYVTALLTPVLLVFLLLLCLIFRKKRGLFCILPLVLMLAGLAVNAMAPGNATRMAAQLDSMGPVEAVYYSFLYAFKGIRDWTTVYLIFFTVLLLPFLCVGLSRCDFDFPLPGVVAGLSYCVVAASYTPSLFSMGQTYIFGRTLNIMRMLFYLLYFLNLVYLTGWVTARCRRFGLTESLLSFFSRLWQGCRRSLTAGMVLFALVLLVFSDKNEITGISAAESIVRGHARSYHEESLYRIALLTQGVDEVWVPNFSVCPVLLDPQELSADDPGDYRNEAVAHWYGVKTLHLSIVY